MRTHARTHVPPRLIELLLADIFERKLSQSLRVLGGQCRRYAAHQRFQLPEENIPEIKQKQKERAKSSVGGV